MDVVGLAQTATAEPTPLPLDADGDAVRSSQPTTSGDEAHEDAGVGEEVGSVVGWFNQDSID